MDKYKISASLDRKYAPLINRSRMIHEQTSKAYFSVLRDRGETNVDLWTDGSIYPQHPISNKQPNFRSVSDLLQFVGDGRSGLLGYVESLCQTDASIQFRLQEAHRELQSMREQVHSLMRNSEENERLLIFTQSELQSRQRLDEENFESLVVNSLLKDEVATLKSENERLIIEYESRLTALNAKSQLESDERLRLEVEMWIEIQSQNESHEKSLIELASVLKRTKATLKRREKRLENLVKTPFGYRSCVREAKDLSNLAPKGGHTKRRIRLARTIMNPTTVKNIQTLNKISGVRRRLCGTKEKQAETGKVLASMLSQSEVSTICEDPKLKPIGVKIVNNFLSKVGDMIKPDDIVETCDLSLISHSGYDAFFKKFKVAAQMTGRGIRVTCLPSPWQVACARKMLNAKLHEYVGEHHCLNETIMVSASARSTKKEPVKVVLNDMNSFFCDVEQVQRTMVHLYDITVAGYNHEPYRMFSIIYV